MQYNAVYLYADVKHADYNKLTGMVHAWVAQKLLKHLSHKSLILILYKILPSLVSYASKWLRTLSK